MRHSGKRGGKIDKIVTKKYVGGGFAAKKCDAIQSKKSEILRVTFFFMLTYFAVFFMSAFVDDVITFL